MVGVRSDGRVEPPLKDRREVRIGAAVIGVTAASRLLCLLALYVGARHHRVHLASLVTIFDGTWYKAIATSGYPHTLPVVHGQVTTNAVGFFPLFPMIVKFLMWATGLGFAGASIFCNTIASGVAALLIYRIAVRRSDLQTAFIHAVVWVVWPVAFVLSLAYSEAVFTALAAGCLLGLLQRRWLLAGVLAALAGATRPPGLILALCCLVAAWAAMRQDRKLGPLVAPLIAPLGTLAYFAWLWDRTGRINAWFVTESQGWHTGFDGGLNNAQKFVQYLQHGQGDGLVGFLSVAVSLVLLILLFIDGDDPLLLTYATGIVLFVAMSHDALSSDPRYLFVAFPLLAPVASRLRRLTWYVVAPALASSAVVMAGVGVYLTTNPYHPL